MGEIHDELKVWFVLSVQRSHPLSSGSQATRSHGYKCSPSSLLMWACHGQSWGRACMCPLGFPCWQRPQAAGCFHQGSSTLNQSDPRCPCPSPPPGEVCPNAHLFSRRPALGQVAAGRGVSVRGHKSGQGLASMEGWDMSVPAPGTSQATSPLVHTTVLRGRWV